MPAATVNGARGRHGGGDQRQPLRPRSRDDRSTRLDHACRAGDRGRPSARRLRDPQDAEARLPLPQASRASSRCATRPSSSTRRFAPPVLVSHGASGRRPAGSTASSAGSTPSSRRWRATPPIRAPGGGLQTFDYFMLQMLNREINVLKHLRQFEICPSRSTLYRGAAAHFAANCGPSRPSASRRDYAAYDHDDAGRRSSSRCWRDIQRLLSLDIGRAIRLDLVERAPNAYRRRGPRPHAVPQRHLRASRSRPSKPLTADPAAVPGALQGRSEHQDERDRADPPAGHRARAHADAAAARSGRSPTTSISISTSLRRCGQNSAQRSSMGLHFAGDWPDLQLDLWAIMEDRR